LPSNRSAPGGARRRLLVGALLAALLTPSPGHAKPPPAAAAAAPGKPAASAPADDPAALAKAHSERALDAYREGRYERAVKELEHAVELDPEGKDLYYNLGLVHEKLGNLDRALFYFRRYLELETLPAERERVEIMVQRLAGAEASARRADAEQAAAPRDPDVAPGAADRPATKPGRWDEWVCLRVGLASASLLVADVHA